MTPKQPDLLEDYKSVQNEISQLKLKIQDVSKKKEFWFEKKEALKKEIKELIHNIKDTKTETDKRAQEVKELKANRNKLNSEVKSLVKKIRKLNEEKDKVFKDYHVKIDPARLQEKINTLEKQVEIETNFDKEKRLMEDIKKLKRAYEESAEAHKLAQEAHVLEKEIRESRKKADQFHRTIQELAQDQNYAKFLALSRQITALKKTQEEAFQIFIEYKNEYIKVNQQLKEKYEQLNKLKSYMEKDRELAKLEQEMKRREAMSHKAVEVEEKLKKKKKLTTDDLLAFQSRDE